MKQQIVFAALVATVLLLSTNPSLADENQTVEAGAVSGETAPVEKGTTSGKIKARHKAVETKPVDINSASPAELKKLPGIGDAEALKIIAGRPYGSKYWLVTEKIIQEGLFMSIKDLIEARQPFKEGDKNAEIYRKLNEKKEAEQKAGEKLKK